MTSRGVHATLLGLAIACLLMVSIPSLSYGSSTTTLTCFATESGTQTNTLTQCTKVSGMPLVNQSSIRPDPTGATGNNNASLLLSALVGIALVVAIIAIYLRRSQLTKVSSPKTTVESD